MPVVCIGNCSVALEEMIFGQRPDSDKEGCMDVVERAIREATKSPRQLVWLGLSEEGGREVNKVGMGPSGIWPCRTL